MIVLTIHRTLIDSRISRLEATNNEMPEAGSNPDSNEVFGTFPYKEDPILDRHPDCY